MFTFEGDAYEKNKSRIKRIIKIKHNLNQFFYSQSIWKSDNPKNKHVVKRIVDPKTEQTKSLLLTNNQPLIKDLRKKFLELGITSQVTETNISSLPSKSIPTTISTTFLPEASSIPNKSKFTSEQINQAYINGKIASFERHIKNQLSLKNITPKQAKTYLEKWTNLIKESPTN